MDVKVGLVFVLLLAGNWACDARLFTRSDLSGSDKKVDVCTLCEEYAALAVDYLAENKTQTEIIEVLHESCSQMLTLKHECITLVDHYATLFFAQISSVQPDEFCEKMNLCQGEQIVSLPAKENSCDVCHQAVNEIIATLKDPDTKLDIIEVLLKGCAAMENYAKKCKAMVFEYGPLILTNAEKYLENADVCATFHACNQAVASTEEKAFDGKIVMVTSS